jgi:hypothetical protein
MVFAIKKPSAIENRINQDHGYYGFRSIEPNSNFDLAMVLTPIGEKQNSSGT